MNNLSQTHRAELQALAKEVRILKGLPKHQSLRLTSDGKLKQFPGQSVVLTEGSPVDEVYLTLRGTVAVGLYPEANPALWLYVSGPGALVDTSALLDPPVSPVTVRALSDLTVLAISREAFVEVIEEEPAVGYRILQDYSSRLALINRVTLKEISEEFPGPALN